MMDSCYPSCWIIHTFKSTNRTDGAILSQQHPGYSRGSPFFNQIQEPSWGGNHFLPGICVPEWSAWRWGIYWRIASEQLDCPPTPLRLRGWTSVSAEVRHKMVLFVQFLLGLEGCRIGIWVRRFGGGFTFTCTQHMVCVDNEGILYKCSVNPTWLARMWGNVLLFS